MAKNPTGSSADRATHPLYERLGAVSAASGKLFGYSAKIICGRQTATDCCCIAGARPGVYATEVNIQNLNLVIAPVVKLVQPLINSGAVVAREPNLTDPTKIAAGQIEELRLPPLAATMDDCCKIAEMLLGAAPSGDSPLTIAILTIASPFELAVSVVYTATPLSGDGISLDVEYLTPQLMALPGQ
jgi:hypothetical protein